MKWRPITVLALVFILLPGCGSKPRSAAEAYIQEHYPDQADWRLETYSDFFRAPSNTYIRAYAPDSQDLYFELYYDSSEELLDDRHDEGIQDSLSGQHTYYRLFNEYHDLVQKKQFQIKLSLSVKLLTDQAAKDALWEQGIIYLDMPLSTDLPLEWEIYYWKDVNDIPTIEEAAQDIRTLGSYLADNGLPAARLSGHLSPPLGPSSSFEIPTELAYDPDLLTKLEAAKVPRDPSLYDSGWTVYIP